MKKTKHQPGTSLAVRRVEATAHRYLHDAPFHALVTRFREALAAGEVTEDDLRDAALFAILLRRSEHNHPA